MLRRNRFDANKIIEFISVDYIYFAITVCTTLITMGKLTNTVTLKFYF